MGRYVLFILFIISVSSCQERYDFVIVNKTEGVVIEAFISDKSFNSTLSYPSDGRYFTVKLSKLSDVTNEKNESISGARVFIIDGDGNEIRYTENHETEEYVLLDKDFAAEPGQSYKLLVNLHSGEVFSSDWAQLPTSSTEVGEVTFIETSRDEYVWVDTDVKEFRSFEGIDVSVKVPKNTSGDMLFYKWDYDPYWVFVASMLDRDHPNKTCWVSSPYYLEHFNMQKDIIGDYSKKMFFVRTIGNSKIYEYFSVLIIQTVLSEEYYNFWKDFNVQSQNGGLFDQPPFNLPTNYSTENSEKSVNGFFGVVNENAKRWVFDKAELSYPVYNDLLEICILESELPGPPMGPTPCDNCTYAEGDSENKPPNWWGK
ncbi:MAG: DUF4249 family protein [Flavobacteriales bacterium]|nr:DUF4249 family protein [Flavobacteriales bacterium]